MDALEAIRAIVGDATHWLHVSRRAEEIALMKQLKALLDPLGILYPGKVL